MPLPPGMPDPTPAAGEVLVATEAATLNPADNALVSGALAARFAARGFEPPFTPGWDLAGPVTSVGDGVDPALVGSQVLGFSPVFDTGEGLGPTSRGVRVRFRGGSREVVPGPFEGEHELPAALTIIRTRSIDEAIEWAAAEAQAVGDIDVDIRPVLARWPNYELDRPTLVSEFGAEGETAEERAQGYLDMWRGIREFPQYVIGGAPYVWTTAGPEPTDKIWGLMDRNSKPVDGTFALLSRAWRQEASANHP